MAFPDHNWTITHNPNKSYTVSCSNFIEKTKSITLTTTNKNFTGDVSINITCANCGAKSVSGIASSSAVTVYTSSSTYSVYASGTMRVNIAESGWIQKGNYDLTYNSYKIGTITKGNSLSLAGNDTASNVTLTSSDATSGHLSVRQNATITISGANTAYYTDSSINKRYSVDTFKVGEVPLSWFKTYAYIGTKRSGSGSSRVNVILYPDSIYVMLDNGSDLYTTSSGNTVIWYNSTGELGGGSLIWFDRSSMEWFGMGRTETAASHKAQGRSSYGYTVDAWIEKDHHIRRIRLSNSVNGYETGSGDNTERVSAFLSSAY